MNWGTIGGYAGAATALASAVGYAYAGDIRRFLYFLFAFFITMTVIWPAR